MVNHYTCTLAQWQANAQGFRESHYHVLTGGRIVVLIDASPDAHTGFAALAGVNAFPHVLDAYTVGNPLQTDLNADFGIVANDTTFQALNKIKAVNPLFDPKRLV